MLSLPRPSGRSSTRPVLGCCSRPSRVTPMSPCPHSWVCVPPSLLTPERLSSHSCVQICTQVLTGPAPVCSYTLGTRGLLDSQPVLTGASSQPLVSPIRPAHISCVYLLHSWASRLPWSTVTCVPVSSNHTRVRGSLLCKCHAPHPRDTWALARVCPVSTPRTMFSQGPLPALPLLGGTGGEGAGCSTNQNVLPVHF